MGLDTSAMAMEMYAKAEWLIFQNKIDKSYNLLDSMLTIFGGHTLSDEILYKQAEIQIKRTAIKRIFGTLGQRITSVLLNQFK